MSQKSSVAIAVIVTAIVVGGGMYLATRQPRPANNAPVNQNTSASNTNVPTTPINNVNASPTSIPTEPQTSAEKELARTPEFVLRGDDQCVGNWEFSEAAAGAPAIASYDIAWRSAPKAKAQYGSGAALQTADQFARLPAGGTVQFKTTTAVATLRVMGTIPSGCRLWLTQK